MKMTALVFAAMVAAATAFGQSYFAFNNKVGLIVDAPFVLCTDPPGTSSVGEGYRVQLFGGNPGTPLDQLVPTDPPGTTIRADRPGYVWPILAVVPGLQRNPATILVRAFDGPTWEGATMRFQEVYSVNVAPVEHLFDTLRLGTAPLVLCAIPEPSPLLLVLFGVGAALLLHPARNSEPCAPGVRLVGACEYLRNNSEQLPVADCAREIDLFSVSSANC